MRSRIMYMEDKSESLNGPARIGRVTFSKTGKTIRYKNQEFMRTTFPLKANYLDVATGKDFWISGPRKDGKDRLYSGGEPVEIDQDIREEYWREVRGRR